MYQPPSHGERAIEQESGIIVQRVLYVQYFGRQVLLGVTPPDPQQLARTRTADAVRSRRLISSRFPSQVNLVTFFLSSPKVMKE